MNPFSFDNRELQYQNHQEKVRNLTDVIPSTTVSPLLSILSQFDSKDVYGSIPDLGITIRTPSDARAVHSVLGKALKNTIVVGTREVFHDTFSHS